MGVQHGYKKSSKVFVSEYGQNIMWAWLTAGTKVVRTTLVHDQTDS